MQAEGVAACAKHFPGHGDTDLDSHLELPSVEHDRARLEAVELVPFRAVVANGVAGVMTSHVVVRSLDQSLPATLSRPVVTGLLRESLAFGGVVITDDMEMGALTKHWSAGEAALAAARAGCDLICVCKTPDRQVEAVEALVRGEESQALPWSEGEASLGRIRALKRRYVSGRAVPDARSARLAAGGGEGPRLAAEIARLGAGEGA
jgi:beta-N-acetylhexosaminidase